MQIGYDKTTIELNIPKERLLGVLTPNEVSYDLTGESEVFRSLENPIGLPRLETLVKPGMKVCIITSDITRPLPSKVVIPPVVKKLNEAGISDQDIVVVFALGSHRPHTEEEKKYLVGDDIYNRIECIDSNPNDCVSVGITKKGTPVDIFRRVVESDFRICLGNIEYHYFAGYSGGAKAIMPGVSTKDAIQTNHKMMVEDSACAGNLLSPVRVDIEEAGKILGINYIVNVVLDEHKKIIKCVSGDVTLAHRVGCQFLDELYQIKLKEKADIVITSAGGYPKDQNMYQAQKALDNAKHAVKDGGIIIWVGACKEGFGSASFESWMKEKTPKERIVDIRNNFVLGGHKAAAISLILEHARIFLVSSLPKELVTNIGLEPQESLEMALSEATKILGEKSKVYVMPYGGSTLPKIV